MQNTEDIIFKDEDTLSLIHYLINVYIAKYPIDGYISKNPMLHLSNIEKYFNERQLNIIKYPYQTSSPIGILFNSKGKEIFINVIIDPTTGIINKEITKSLNDIALINIEDNITIIELYNYILSYDIPNISIDSLTSYVNECQKRLELRNNIIEYVIKSLIASDMNIMSNGIYRSEMFKKEMNIYYHTKNKLVLKPR